MLKRGVCITMTWQILLGWLIISCMLWFPGYIHRGQNGTDQIHLPKFMKIFYGRWNKPLYLRGALLQTLAIVLASGYIIEFLAFNLGKPVLFPAMPLFILCLFFLGTVNIFRLVYTSLQQNLLRRKNLPNMSLSKKETGEYLSAPQIKLDRNWWQIILVAFVLFAALTLPLIWLTTNQAVQAVNAGVPLPGGWTWTTVIGFDIMIFWVSLYLIWIPVKDMLTLFTEQGIRQPRWFGLRHVYLKWSEVEQIDEKHSTIRIIGSHKTIQLNVLLFKHPDKVMNEIRKRVPNSAFQI